MNNNKKISFDELEKNHKRRLASIRNIETRTKTKTEHIMHVFDREEKILEILKQRQEQEKGPITTLQIADMMMGISRYSIYNTLVNLERKGKIKSYKEKLSEFRIVVRYWHYHCYDQNQNY